MKFLLWFVKRNDRLYNDESKNKTNTIYITTIFLFYLSSILSIAMSRTMPINVIMYDFNLVSDLFDFGLDRNQFKQLVKIRSRELL